ncbi:hypothetical protein CPB84DRAFT_1760813 [Gymnopilus junonius]|uniref:Cytochrome b561 domain-containing protein n=1 Tax=Gymnopilus junonius TaxID=109634 RepID=A0A9P5NXE9_GYMJU|nr:hypothetical protein CPB84DRAFT_1760813 [Gymnopilus junonius]
MVSYMRLFISIILCWLQCIPFGLALKGDSGCRRAVCASATVEGDMVHYEVTSLMKPVGWVALGFGAQMIHTHSIVLWRNSDGTTTLSQRYATGYREPRPEDSPSRVATLIEPKTSVVRPAESTTFAFQIPVNHSLLASADSRESMIFAYSPNAPDKDPASALPVHHETGYFTFDLTKEFVSSFATTQGANMASGQTTTKTSSYNRLEKLIILHGFLVSIGFLVILPAGSLIGRWARSFTPAWFKAHWVSNMVVAAPIITFGVILGPIVVSAKVSFRVHFANAHEICGAILLLAYFAQVLLGRYIHERRNRLAKLGPITRAHPPLNILHIVLGVSIIGLSFFQIRSGLEWWETLTGRGPIASWTLPLWKAWIVILPVAYFGGYALLPRQLRLERETGFTPISESQTTHLLADDEEERPQ